MNYPDECERMAVRDEVTDGQESANGDEETIGVVERRIDQLIDERTDDIDARVDDLERELNDLDDFARVSLSERRVQKNEEALSELSNSTTDFAERTFAKTNALERQLEKQSVVLAVVLDALEEADVEVDLSDVERYREENLVTDTTAEERLDEALDRLS